MSATSASNRDDAAHPWSGPAIAVVGAGFSGTMTALHLLEQTGAARILLCERAPTFARGAAYSTGEPAHLVNVRASSMSAFPDCPEHFTDWLAAHPAECCGHAHETAAGLFVSRALYGRYLSAIVQDALAGEEGACRLRIVPDEVVGIARRPGGFAIELAGGRRHEVAAVVLSIGNPAAPGGGVAGPVVRDPWAAPLAEGLRPGRPVVIVGAGLTMVDIVTSLHAAGFAGPVVAISRRGLLPRVHVPPRPWELRDAGRSGALSPSGLVRWVRGKIRRAERAGIPWQSVIDALRPLTSGLWRGLSRSGQASVLRHLRPWWDVHRHRMAPPVGGEIGALVRQGYLSVAAGRVGRIEQVGQLDQDGDHVRVEWRPRGSPSPQVIGAQRVIFASGPPAVERVGDRLVDALIAAGLARPGPHGLGLDVADDLALLGPDGEPVDGLWAIGPLVRGRFWECTAVPDIRNDAVRLAGRISEGLPS